MITSPRALREASYRRDLASLSQSDKLAFLKLLLVARIGRCKQFDLHKLRSIHQLIESFQTVKK